MKSSRSFRIYWAYQ